MKILKDAVDGWGILADLEKSKEASKNASSRERIEHVIKILKDAQNSLKELIQQQNMEYYPVFQGATPEEQDREGWLRRGGSAKAGAQ